MRLVWSREVCVNDNVKPLKWRTRQKRMHLVVLVTHTHKTEPVRLEAPSFLGWMLGATVTMRNKVLRNAIYNVVWVLQGLQIAVS